MFVSLVSSGVRSSGMEATKATTATTAAAVTTTSCIRATRCFWLNSGQCTVVHRVGASSLPVAEPCLGQGGAIAPLFDFFLSLIDPFGLFMQVHMYSLEILTVLIPAPLKPTWREKVVLGLPQNRE